MTTALRIVGTLGLLGLLAWRLEWGQVAASFAGLSPGWWLLGCAVFALAQLASAWRWRCLAAPLGFEVPLSRMASLYFVGMFFNLVLPTSVGGDAMRVWLLTRQAPAYRWRWASALLSVFADRFSGLAVLVAMAGLGALATPLPAAMAWAVAGVVACLAAGLACLPALPLLERLPLAGKPAAKVRQMLRAYALQPGTQAAALLLSVVVQMANVAMVWLMAVALGLQVPFAYLMVAVPLLCLLMLLPVSVGGHGVREAGLALLLAPAGVPAAAAVSLSLAWTAGYALVASAGGLIYLAGPYPRVSDLQRPTDAQSLGRDPGEGRTRQPAQAA